MSSLLPTLAERELFRCLRPARLASPRVTWSELAHAARRWGVAPLLASHAVGTEAHKELKPTLLQATAQHLAHQAIYRQIRAAWSDLGVEHAPLKGLTLAERFYSPPQARTMCDIDLLVREDDLEPAVQSLLRLPGFSLVETIPEGPWRRAQKDVGLNVQLGESTFLVEVHYRIEQFSRLDIDYRSVWQRATPDSEHRRQLDINDELVFTAYHLSRSNYPHRFIWYLDIHALANSDPDWEAVVERARAWGCATALWIVLLRAQSILQEQLIPRFWLERLAPPRPTQRYLCALLPSDTPRTLFDRRNIRLPQLALWLPLMDRWRDRVAFVSQYTAVRARDIVHQLSKSVPTNASRRRA